jgi:acetyl esterase
MLLSLPALIMCRWSLLNANDKYWEEKIGTRALEIDGRRLNPRAQAYIALIEKLSIPQEQWTPKRLRLGFDKTTALFNGPITPVSHVRDIELRLPGRNIAARQYCDNPAESGRPGILFFHGGGFVIGSLQSHDSFCRTLAALSGNDVIAVDYRLAPEHRMPAALEDAVDSWDWLIENAAILGLNPDRLTVVGDSAGAHMAVKLASETSKRSETTGQPKAIGLIYPPMIHKGITKSRELLGKEKIILTNELLDWFECHYLPESLDALQDQQNFLDNAIAGSMPPTWILTCGFDPFRDEARMLAGRLTELEAEVEFIEYSDQYHGFITLSGLFRGQINTLISDMSEFLNSHNKPFASGNDQE